MSYEPVSGWRGNRTHRVPKDAGFTARWHTIVPCAPIDASPVRAGGVHHCYSRCQRTTGSSGWRESNPLLQAGNLMPNQWATAACVYEPQVGIEPTTSGLRNRRCYRLSY